MSNAESWENAANVAKSTSSLANSATDLYHVLNPGPRNGPSLIGSAIGASPYISGSMGGSNAPNNFPLSVAKASSSIPEVGAVGVPKGIPMTHFDKLRQILGVYDS